MPERYWVSFTGLFGDDDSHIVALATSNRTFLRELTAALNSDPLSTQVACYLTKKHRLSLSAVVPANNKSEAVTVAHEVFSTAIDKAGGKADFPEGWQRWRAEALDALLERSETQVIPLAAPVAA